MTKEEALAKGRKIGAPLGGKAVAEQRGSGYMAEIGRRGYKATLERHGPELFERARDAGNLASMDLELTPEGEMLQMWSEHYLRQSG